jgi:hypothetical protein
MAIWAALGKAISGITKSGGGKAIASTGKNAIGSNIGKWAQGANAAKAVQSSQLGSAASSLSGSMSNVPSLNTGTTGGANPNAGGTGMEQKNRFWGGEGKAGGAMDSFAKILDPSGVLVGLGQKTISGIQAKNARSRLFGGATPAEVALLNETSRMRKAAQTNLPFYQMASNRIAENTALNRAFKTGGRGAVPAVTSAINQSLMQISADAANKQMGLLQQEAEGTKYGGQIKRDIGMLGYTQGMADKSLNQQAANQNLLASLSSLPDLIKKKNDTQNTALGTYSSKFKGAASKAMNSSLPFSMGGKG